MDDFFHEIKDHPWTFPFAASFILHLLVVVILMFIVIPSIDNPNEHVTQSFRVKGVQDLPVIQGEPGGGETRHFENPRVAGKDASFSIPSTVKDVSLEALVDSPNFSKQISMEVQPKKSELETDSMLESRDFQVLLTKTQESQLVDKVQYKQQSTRAEESGKTSTKSRVPGQEMLVRVLQNSLAALNLSAIPSLAIDPEEGMPGFTPMGAGGGGGGGSGTGSPGGFLDGLMGEPKQNVLKYDSLDKFLDIQVLTYQDPAQSQPAGGGSASGGKYFMIKIFANKNAGQFTVMPKEILFTIDCSLSISQERLGEFKRGIGYCLANLNNDDLFNIVAFQDKTAFFSEKSLKATPETIQQAGRFVSELTSNRNTDVYGAFEKILQTPPARNPSNIILISDGRPTHGVVNSRELINSITRLNNKVRPIFAYSGGAKVNRYLLDFISYQNRAWSQFVKDRGKIHKGLSDFYAKIKDPIFLNLRYQLNGLNNDEVFPKSLPDFYRNAEFTLYGKYENENDFSMQLLGDVGGKTSELIFTRSLKEAPKGGPDIMKGYAFNKIYYLISQVTTNEQSKEILKQIQELGQRYKVTTPYSLELAEVD